jgi:arsenite methyltransferase
MCRKELLDDCRAIATRMGGLNRCRFLRVPAEELSPIEEAPVDVVTNRSMLIYVRAKDQAFREFHRMLRPGERVSIFEPINRYFADEPGSYWGFDTSEVLDLVEKIEGTFQSSDQADGSDDGLRRT